ncbi:MAG TPA: hypothetical protein VG944_23055 [Fimbriimonas sp.]|nr:hypothetical protein [Fimbriimonas sp.]
MAPRHETGPTPHLIDQRRGEFVLGCVASIVAGDDAFGNADEALLNRVEAIDERRRSGLDDVDERHHRDVDDGYGLYFVRVSVLLLFWVSAEDHGDVKPCRRPIGTRWQLD